MARQSPLTRMRLPLILLALAALVGGWWYARQLKTYRLVRQFPLTLCPMPGGVDGADISAGIIYSEAGLLMRTDARHVTLYDWEGKRKWDVDTGPTDKHVIRSIIHYPLKFVGWSLDLGAIISLSPSGRYLSALTLHGNVLHLTTWHDGKKVGTLRLPLKQAAHTQENPFTMRMLDSGQVMLAVVEQARVISTYKLTEIADNGTYISRTYPIYKYANTLYHINGRQQLAKGFCGNISNISPDGLTVIEDDIIKDDRYFVSQVKTLGNKIMVKHVNNYTYREVIGYGTSSPLTGLLANGLTFSGDAIYDGKTPKAKLKYPGRIFTVPGARHILQYGPAGQLEVLDLSTFTSWAVNPVGAYGGGVLTMDGCHVLVIPGHRNSYRFPPLVERIITLNWAERDTLIDTAARALVLYEAPGRAVAHLPLRDAGYSNGQPYTGSFWGDYSLNGIYPSPDGRSLIAIGKPRTGGYQCLVFRY